QMDGFIQVSPDNRYLLTSAAEANIGYAFLFVEDIDKPRAKLLYTKGREYAMRILKKNRSFSKALAEDDLDNFRASLKSISKNDVAALYFATQGWMSWMNLAKADTPDIMKDLPKIEAMMDRILELDETFYHGGVHALMGAYNASRPEMIGGNMDEARAHFKEAVEISEGRYLLWHYLYARYYAVQTRNRDLFTDTLNKVLSAPDDILPEESFANSAAKMKARELLSHADDYFK
ncbi:MAG: TRAP transporter TatT component family protein, partial [Methanothrix sp.]|nr:TRAP transporter TatT component family protein [Methanothrix sp.]